MSADNWATCPLCKTKAEKDYQLALVKANDAYGKVPVSEYELLKAKVEEPIADDQTLREDYGIGIYESEFRVSYSGYCDVCKFKYAFKREVKLDPK